MSKWFRWYEGTCEDGKFRCVARNAGVTVAAVMGVWAALLEDASNDDHRGVATRGEDFYAAILDLPSDELKTILQEMDEIGIISVGHGNITITKWKERQFESDAIDSTNADRQRRWREKQKANGKTAKRNGSVTAAKLPDKDTETEKKDAASAASADPEIDLFRRGKEVLGKNAGGLISQLLKAKGGKVTDARAAIETAAGKQNPREYIGGVVRKKPDEPQWLDGIPGVL